MASLDSANGPSDSTRPFLPETIFPSLSKSIAGKPLEREGKIVSGKNGRVVSDGPFAESKEAIGGYFLLNVNTLDEAVAIAKECPGLPYGAKVEVRPVMEQCPLAAKAQRESQLAETHA